MTRFVLSKMCARSKGVVINIGSAAGAHATPFPLFSIYSATKVFVDYFTRGLQAEYAAKKNMFIQVRVSSRAVVLCIINNACFALCRWCIHIMLYQKCQS